MGSCISVDQPVIQRRGGGGGGGNRRQIAPPYQTSCSSSPRSKDDGSSTLVGSPSSQGSGRPCLLLSPTDSSVISDADVERLLKEFVTCRSLHSQSTTTRHDQRMATGDSIAMSDVAQHGAVAAGEFPNPLVISGTVLMGQSPQQHGSLLRFLNASSVKINIATRSRATCTKQGRFASRNHDGRCIPSRQLNLH